MDDALVDPGELERLDDEMLQAWADRDVDALLDHFSDDAVMVSAGRPVAVGGAAVRAALEETLGQPGREIAAWRVAAGLHHVRLGWTLVAYTARMQDQEAHTGRYLAMWHQHPDGRWSIVSYASMPDV